MCGSISIEVDFQLNSTWLLPQSICFYSSESVSHQWSCAGNFVFSGGQKKVKGEKKSDANETVPQIFCSLSLQAQWKRLWPKNDLRQTDKESTRRWCGDMRATKTPKSVLLKRTIWIYSKRNDFEIRHDMCKNRTGKLVFKVESLIEQGAAAAADEI